MPLYAKGNAQQEQLQQEIAERGEKSPVAQMIRNQIAAQKSGQSFQEMYLMGRTRGPHQKSDWTENLNGERYLEIGELAGRPDLQRKIRDIVVQLTPRVSAVEDEFSNRYN